MSELLPCPFCGGEGKIVKLTHGYLPRCTKCMISLPTARDREKAVESWNTRYKESTVYDKEETIEGCTVQILTNSVTGEQSVGWWRGKKEDMP